MPVDIANLLDDSVQLTVTWKNPKTESSFDIAVQYRPLWYTWSAVAAVEGDPRGDPNNQPTVHESNLETLCRVLKSWDLAKGGQVIELTPDSVKTADVPIRLIEHILRTVMADMAPPKASERSSQNGSDTAQPLEVASAASPNGSH
jgi:hypothetical protein